MDEAIERAGAIVAEKRPELGACEAEEIARTIGLGAVKYAELSQHRMTDYIFSWSKMLSFQGNTAPYLQNAYVRIRSIFRKLEGEFAVPDELVLAAAEERALAVKLLQFGEVIPPRSRRFSAQPSRQLPLRLGHIFHAFYEACPVLKAETAESRATRLVLCDVTARVLQRGLNLWESTRLRECKPPATSGSIISATNGALV